MRRAGLEPVPDRYDVRKAHPAKAADLAETLARAFYDDPLIGWLLPDHSRRLAIARRGFDLYLRRVWLRHEETHTVENSAGVCVWEPPGTWKVGVREQLSLLPTMLRIYGRMLPRLLGTINAVEKGPSDGAALLPGLRRYRAREPGARNGLDPDAPDPPALRCREGSRLSRGQRPSKQSPTNATASRPPRSSDRARADRRRGGCGDRPCERISRQTPIRRAVPGRARLPSRVRCCH